MISKVSQSIYVYKTTLLYVKDGDTIEANIDLGFNICWKAAIRFSGIDTYETHGSTAHPIGTKAKLFLEALFAKFGTEFYLHSLKDEVAIYNRVAGKLYLETVQDGKRAFVDVIETIRMNGFDKSGKVPYVEGREPLYKIIAAADIDSVIRPV